jgi:hypothetical protein
MYVVARTSAEMRASMDLASMGLRRVRENRAMKEVRENWYMCSTLRRSWAGVPKRGRGRGQHTGARQASHHTRFLVMFEKPSRSSCTFYIYRSTLVAPL